MSQCANCVELQKAVEYLQSKFDYENYEPVAWLVCTREGRSVCGTDNPADFSDEHLVYPLYTTPPILKEDK